ncbi:NXPE family member 4-like [Amphiura filiformis]|uniref:NXPE family member 4-like n=1 Tax=Amphiura filiformis TaxID=82378 RepID=UPI003B218CDA
MQTYLDCFFYIVQYISHKYIFILSRLIVVSNIMDCKTLKSRRRCALVCVFACCLIAYLTVWMTMPTLQAPFMYFYLALRPSDKVTADDSVSLGETNAANCRYHVLNNGSISKGDIVKIRIDARDKYNQARFVGGDFWFAWLDSKKPVASTAGKIIDHNNGTYLVSFLAAWAGHADINIILVHPSDATTFMKEVFWNTDKKIFWQGYYRSPKATQTVLCTIQSPGIWENKCTYPRPVANGRTSFVCDKPPGLPCSSLAQYKTHSAMIDTRTTEILGDKKFLFEWGNYNQKISGNIKRLHFKESSVTFNLDGLPTCQPQTPIPSITGYWMHNQWHPFHCRKYNCWTNSIKVAECLRNKEIYIMGDSNGRQYYNEIIPLLPPEPADVDVRKSEHMHWYTKTYNISMTFDFHPESIASHWLTYGVFHYEVDILDQLVNAECNYVIIISTWAHFTQWTRSAFVERVGLLREAVDRFVKRCPNAPIILKSPHPRDHWSLQSRLLCSDFMLYQLRKILRKIFADSGVFFLDVWDMNIAFPAENSIHMPTTVVDQELFMILSYVCNSTCEY